MIGRAIAGITPEDNVDVAVKKSGDGLAVANGAHDGDPAVGFENVGGGGKLIILAGDVDSRFNSPRGRREVGN